MIFIDRNTPCVPNAHWRWETVCHMWTDGDLEELHEFAESLGLKRAWFQPCDRPGLQPNRRSHNDCDKNRCHWCEMADRLAGEASIFHDRKHLQRP